MKRLPIFKSLGACVRQLKATAIVALAKPRVSISRRATGFSVASRGDPFHLGSSLGTRARILIIEIDILDVSSVPRSFGYFACGGSYE